MRAGGWTSIRAAVQATIAEYSCEAAVSGTLQALDGIVRRGPATEQPSVTAAGRGTA
jgi:hypothetical protein